MTLSREAILRHVDKRIGKVEVEEFGGEVCVASLTVAEADRIRTISDSDVPASVVITILGACGGDGVRLFTDADIDALKAMPASAISKIANAVLKHNGLVEEPEKNESGEAENGDSATASLSPSAAPSPSLKAA